MARGPEWRHQESNLTHWIGTKTAKKEYKVQKLFPKDFEPGSIELQAIKN